MYRNPTSPSMPEWVLLRAKQYHHHHHTTETEPRRISLGSVSVQQASQDRAAPSVEVRGADGNLAERDTLIRRSNYTTTMSFVKCVSVSTLLSVTTTTSSTWMGVSLYLPETKQPESIVNTTPSSRGKVAPA